MLGRLQYLNNKQLFYVYKVCHIVISILLHTSFNFSKHRYASFNIYEIFFRIHVYLILCAYDDQLLRENRFSKILRHRISHKKLPSCISKFYSQTSEGLALTSEISHLKTSAPLLCVHSPRFHWPHFLTFVFISTEVNASHAAVRPAKKPS